MPVGLVRTRRYQFKSLKLPSTFGELISTYGDNPTAFLDLKSGRVDALVVDEVVGLNLIEKNS